MVLKRVFGSGPVGFAVARSRRPRIALALAVVGVALITLLPWVPRGARCAAHDEPVQLALDEARSRAMDHNYDYAIAKLEFAASEIQFKMAEADALLRPSVIASKRAAGARKDAARALVAKEQSLMLEVDKAYYNLVTAQERMEIIRKSEAQTQESLRIVRLKSDAGLASKMDVMSAEIAAERATAETISAGNQLELVQLALKQTLGIDLGVPVVAVDSAQPIAGEADYEAAVARSLASRPEIVKAREALEIAQLEVGFADNEYTPELTRQQLGNALDQAKLAAAKAEREVRVEVRRMYLSLEESRRAISIASASAKETEESYRIMKLRYEHGMEIANSMLGAQLSLTQAKLAELQAVMNYNIARLQFDAWTDYPAEDAQPGEPA